MPFSPEMSLTLKTCISGCSFAHPLDLRWLKVGFLRDSATLVRLKKVIVTLLLEVFQLCVCCHFPVLQQLWHVLLQYCACSLRLCLHVPLLPWCWHPHGRALFSVFKCSLSSLCHSCKPPRLFTSSILSSFYSLLHFPLPALPDSFLLLLSSLNYFLLHHPSFLTSPCSPLPSPSSMLCWLFVTYSRVNGLMNSLSLHNALWTMGSISLTYIFTTLSLPGATLDYWMWFINFKGLSSREQFNSQVVVF